MTTKFTPTQLRQMSDEWMAVGTLTAHRTGHMLRQAADDAEDAERWREFIRCGWPVCFLGETYDNAADLNAAVDTARKEPK